MKLIKDILYKVPIIDVMGSTLLSIVDVSFDSRKVNKGTLFVALKGVQTDGHLYIDKAIELGAKAVVCEEMPSQIDERVTYVKVADTNLALAFIAANYYDNPSENLNLIGVTGTNGKTTLASLSYSLFQKAGFPSGLISTVKISVADQSFKTTHTTPDALTINYYLSKMVKAGSVIVLWK